MKRIYLFACVLAISLSWYLVSTAVAEPGNAPDAGKGALSWGQQVARAPHVAFSGAEYSKDKWSLIMLQIATLGGLPYSEAKNISGFLERSAPDYSGPIPRNVLLTGYGDIKLASDNSLRVGVSQSIHALIAEHWLFQSEFEFEAPLNPERKVKFNGVEYFTLTYFPSWERIHISVGKLMTDFNFSRIRLHPGWINPFQDMPWTMGMVPESTMGGKIGWNMPLSNGMRLEGSFFGGTKSTVKYLDAEEIWGGRIGMHLPLYGAEFGFSAARADSENKWGMYAIKDFQEWHLRLMGESVLSSSQKAAWLGGVWSPFESGWQKDFSFATRIQTLKVKKHHDEDADATTMTEDGMPVVKSEEGHDEHEGMPEKSATALYVGVNYRVPFLQKYQGVLKFGGTLDLHGDSGVPAVGATLTVRW